MGSVSEQMIDEAAEFLVAISPSRGDSLRFRRHPREWIFRGQGDAAWRLTPSAFRINAKFLTRYGWQTLSEYEGSSRPTGLFGSILPPSPPVPPWNLQEDVELQTLAKFFMAADEAGLPLPDDSQLLRSRLIKEFGDIEWLYGWPPTMLLSILALAQHHELPTRLLDWTWDPLAAAFFAAMDAVKGETQALAVWALDVSALDLQSLNIPPPPPKPGFKEREPEPARLQIEMVTAPGATNENLRAQRGLFTLLRATELGKRESNWREIEHLSVDRAVEELSVFIDLYKFVLPTNQARDVLRLLAVEGITAARLFPGFGGVVRSLRDEPLWRE